VSRSAPPRALVTGATGFVGGHLTRRLLAAGWEVDALTRTTSRREHLPAAVLPLPIPPTARALAETLSGRRHDVVFHLATLFRGIHAVDDVEPLIAANVLFGAQLAEALAAAPPKVLLTAGTAWQYDHRGEYRPAALYAATKMAFEDILRFYADRRLFPVPVVNLFDTYGPEDRRGKLVAALVSAAHRGVPLEMSPGEQLIDLLHVDDVTSALMQAARAGSTARWSVWSASSGDPVTLRALVGRLERALGMPVPVAWGAREYRAVEMFEPFIAGPRVPGWSPTVDPEAGLREVFGSAAATPP